MKTGFIGIGNMGGAILDSFAACSGGTDIIICDLNVDACEARKKEYPHITVADSIGGLVSSSDVIVAGVKPQGLAPVLEEIRGSMSDDRILISMAAGVNISWILGFLGEKAKVIRIMPNTPAKVGEGMIALCAGENITDEDLKKAKEILSPAGRIEIVKEEQIDCVIGVSGSSPAYTYMYIEALVNGAKNNGMDEDKARVFAAQSVLGAAKMVLESEESLEQLRINVCSPGGTTIEAVEKLLENGFMDSVQEGFQAAVDRSIEMTREKEEGEKQ